MATPLVLPRFYAILDAEWMGGRPRESVCETLLRSGVRLFQYRDKRGSSRDLLEAASLLMPMIREYDGMLIVNDRADVALMANTDGVHLGQDDLPVETARRAQRAGQKVGCSTHTLDQVREAEISSADYVAFGPVFATSSKEIARPAVGLDALSEARRATSKPLVAIGGITVENARSAIAHGADSVAVISGLLGAQDLGARAREFIIELSSCSAL